MNRNLFYCLFTSVVCLSLLYSTRELFAACTTQSTNHVTVCVGERYCYCPQTDTYSLPVAGTCLSGCSLITADRDSRCKIALNRSKNESGPLSCPAGCIEGDENDVTSFQLNDLKCCTGWRELACKEDSED